MARNNTNVVTPYITHGEIITAKVDQILVDLMDLPQVARHSWYITTRGYAATRINGKIVYLHRMLMRPEELQVDHINRNKLDNRRSNLRIVTNQQNHFNMPVNSNNSSGVSGVYWHRQCRKWCVQITVNGRTIHGGLYSDLKNAALRRKELEDTYFRGRKFD